ncbi:hypothetical protein M3182_20470 [Mesobacillus maritimus]|uniref:hypothetical protein n=1 Tax=Mesobacillus maritimus TaxID=1643336 RepID=UPI00204245F5|nr:hypothetical protein [Mesobacillus maritimus]MCM3588082.1 hypothetical protein [Mesobacillus maritimus]MCM3668413.1 hypothetical protein [Mesobacillus maritimus]
MVRLLIVMLFLFGLLLFGKGMELWLVQGQVGALGTDIHFLGLKMVGHVLKDGLSVYAFGFTVSGLIPILVAINLIIKQKIDKDRHIA